MNGWLMVVGVTYYSKASVARKRNERESKVFFFRGEVVAYVHVQGETGVSRG